jgi:NAD(P)-dependent dehydrogenase (short-subunit alcohol dehydrogenase family)
VRLEGKIAYITGAGSGIGRASALAMAAEGATIVATDRNADTARETVDLIEGQGARAIAMTVDVTDPTAVKSSLDETVDAFGRLDVMHLNAGGSKPLEDSSVVDTPEDVWEFCFRVNVMGVVHGAKYGIPLMIENGGGNIVITSSAAGERGDYALTAYGSLKAAVSSFTRYVATQYGRQGINANAILPGLVMSPGAARLFPEPLAAAVQKHQVTDRLSTPEDVARLAVFLASDDAIAIRGQGIVLDAGISVMGGASPDLSAAMTEMGLQI